MGIERNGFIIYGITIFNFYVEMLLAVLVITDSLPRAKNIKVKSSLALAAALILWLAGIFLIPASKPIYEYLRYFYQFMVCLAGIYICFDVSLGKMFFCGVAAYALQHCINRIYILIFYFLSFAGWGGTWLTAPYFAAYWMLLLLMYAIAYAAVKKRLILSATDFSTKTQLAAILSLLFVTLFLSTTYDPRSENYANTICFLLCDALCAGLIVMLQFSAYGISRKELELMEAEQLHQLEKRQMRQTKEMMELINVKSHDLKHQLISAGIKLNEDEAEEIAHAVYAYDRSVQTGSEALDLVVAQKKMICEKKGIMFSYMLDGELLSFMSDPNIYAMVGNILDNAMEAAEKLPDPRRYIFFELKRVKGFVLLRAENEFAGELNVEKGQIVTSKDRKLEHGFGLKSIAMITEKYGGSIHLSAEDGVFVLTAAFPEQDAG